MFILKSWNQFISAILCLKKKLTQYNNAQGINNYCYLQDIEITSLKDRFGKVELLIMDFPAAQPRTLWHVECCGTHLSTCHFTMRTRLWAPTNTLATKTMKLNVKLNVKVSHFDEWLQHSYQLQMPAPTVPAWPHLQVRPDESYSWRLFASDGANDCLWICKIWSWEIILK